MIYKIFSLYDSKVEAYLRPFFEQTSGSAIRAVTQAVNDKSSQFSKYPQDFTLFELGEFDDSSASFNLHLSPKSLGVMSEYVESHLSVV